MLKKKRKKKHIIYREAFSKNTLAIERLWVMGDVMVAIYLFIIYIYLHEKYFLFVDGDLSYCWWLPGKT